MKRQRTPVDWALVRRRLAATERALARSHEPGPRAGGSLMQSRAQAHAAARTPPPPHGEGLEVVEFVLGPQHCAIEAAFVREVQPLEELTGVPCTPPFVSGIINAHGRILAVIDLQEFLGLAESGLSDLNKVVILQHGDVEFGILADRIVGTRWLPRADVQAPPPHLAGHRGHCLQGITAGQLVVLDACRLLAEPALVVDEEVSA